MDFFTDYIYITFLRNILSFYIFLMKVVTDDQWNKKYSLVSANLEYIIIPV